MSTKRQYTMTEKVIAAKEKQVKHFELSEVNQKYMESFRLEKFPEEKQKASWAQYKCSIGNFLQIVGKDAVEVTETDIAIFIKGIEKENTRNNKIAHIKSFLSHLIKNNIENCRERASKDTLFLIISL